MNSNLRIYNTLKQSQFVDVGLIAARNVQAALDYEKRMLWFTLNIPAKNLSGLASGKGKVSEIRKMLELQKKKATTQ